MMKEKTNYLGHIFAFSTLVALTFSYQNCAKTSKSFSQAQVSSLALTIRSLEPALAIRASGCITCHATVESNFVTDFGYGGGGGRDFFFGMNSGSGLDWNSGSIYGDHGASSNPAAGSLANLNIDGSKKIFVPAAALPSIVQADTGNSTVADYVRDRMASSHYSRAQSTTVETKAELFIGAPSANSLLAAFQTSGGGQQIIYRKADPSSPALSGLYVSGNGQYIQNIGPVVCDGDVLVKGTLHLENVQLSTNNGCRIYVTESVFMYGPLNYINHSGDHNLQITSARSINLGLGNVTQGGTICDSNDWYAPRQQHAGTHSSLDYRYKHIWTVPSQYTRSSQTPSQMGDQVLADAAKIGTLYDAICRPETRAVAYERLLLNAPHVHSRYEGTFRGTIIAEYALISLGSFSFEFDPIFSKVDVLPLLTDYDFMKISE